MNKIVDAVDAVYKKAIAKAYATVESATNEVLNFLLNEARNTNESLQEHIYIADNPEDSEETIKDIDNLIKEEQEYIVEILNEAWERLTYSRFEFEWFANYSEWEEEFWCLFENYNIHSLEFNYLKLYKLERTIRYAVQLNQYSKVVPNTTVDWLKENIEAIKELQRLMGFLQCDSISEVYSDFIESKKKFIEELKKFNYFDYTDEGEWHEDHYGIAEGMYIESLLQDARDCEENYKKYIK